MSWATALGGGVVLLALLVILGLFEVARRSVDLARRENRLHVGWTVAKSRRRA